MKAIANLIPELFDNPTGKYKESDVTDLTPFFFTFSKGSLNSKKYVVIWSNNWDTARDEMNQFFGKTWCFQYDAQDWLLDGISIAEKYGLSQIEIKPLNK